MQITGLETLDLATARVLFRKVLKGLNNKDFVIAQQEFRIRQLKSKVIQLEPRKRRKVQTSPNSKFASIKAIKRAQIAAEDREDVLLDSDDTATIVSTLSHITIKE